MELSGRDFDRIPPGNLHVPVPVFARLWLTAEQRADQRTADRQRKADAGDGQPDWYLAGVQITCRWLGCTFVTFNFPAGPRLDRAHAPITQTRQKAYEELVERETQEAERMVARGGHPARPGFAEGVLATLAWAWRRSGVPPIEVQQTQAR